MRNRKLDDTGKKQGGTTLYIGGRCFYYMSSSHGVISNMKIRGAPFIFYPGVQSQHIKKENTYY